MDLENIDFGFEDAMVTALYESIDNPKYLNILTESIDINNDIILEYKPLIESVEKYHNLKNEKPKSTDSPTKIFKFFSKCKQTAKNVFNWWYKEEPDKKLKNLKIVLKILISITLLVLAIKLPGSGAIADKVMFTKTGNIARTIGYKGSSKILSQLFNARSLVLITIKTIYLSIIEALNLISSDIYTKVNMKDIDSNIKAYDESIDKLNDKIDNEKDPKTKDFLIKHKKDLENVLAKLEQIKNR